MQSDMSCVLIFFQTDAERSVIKFKFLYNAEGATSTTMSKSVSQEKPQTKKWQDTSQGIYFICLFVFVFGPVYKELYL